MTVLSTFLES